MKISITKGKLLKGDKLEVEYEKQLPGEMKAAKCSEEHQTPPHKDLKNAMQALCIHAALLGEFISPVLVPDITNYNPELVKDFTVTGFTLSYSKDDTESIIITASKSLKTGKRLGFNTPICGLFDTSEKAYQFVEYLEECVSVLKKEFAEYLAGKYAEDPQGSLFAEVEGINKIKKSNHADNRI